MSDVSDSDRAILLFVAAFRAQYMRPPTTQDVAETRGLAGREAARRLELLRLRGYLRHAPGYLRHAPGYHWRGPGSAIFWDIPAERAA